MFKKLLLLSSAICLMLMLSGCSKYSTNIEITNKDQVILNQSVLLSVDLYKTLDSGFNPENPYKAWDRLFSKKTENHYRERDFKVRNINDDEYIGKAFSKQYKHIKYFFKEDLPAGYSINSDSSLAIEIKGRPFGTDYIVNLKFDPKKFEEKATETFIKKQYLSQKNEEIVSDKTANQQDIEVKEETEEKNLAPEELEKLRRAKFKTLLKNPCDIELTIKIPKAAYQHNATSFNPKTHEYTWKLSETNMVKNGQSVNIILKYRKINFIGIFFLILIIIGTAIVINKNKVFTQTVSDETKEAF